jgi:hypothetical protein
MFPQWQDMFNISIGCFSAKQQHLVESAETGWHGIMIMCPSVTIGAVTATLPGHLNIFTTFFLCRSIFSFLCSVLWIIVFPFQYLLAILLSVLRFTNSDYTFGIVNLFLSMWSFAKEQLPKLSIITPIPVTIFNSKSHSTIY